MAKYDWKQLEKEYILSDYKSVSAFLRDKSISRSGNVVKITKGWNEKKAQKELKKGSKTIEKVIEKEAEKEAQQIVTIKDVATDLIKKISSSTDKIKELRDIKQLTSALKDLNEIVGQDSTSIDKEKETIEQLSTEKLEAIADAIIRERRK